MNFLKKITSNQKMILIALFAILIILVSIDIFTGIWHINRQSLKFSDSAFNNIVSPIANLIAIGIYTLTLFYSIRQNKVINSFRFKETFIKEMNSLKNNLLKNSIKVNESKNINTIDFYFEIDNVLNRLWEDKEYNDDFKKNDLVLNQDEINLKTYADYHFLLDKFISHNGLWRLKVLQNFIIDVINSELITNHKKEIIKDLESEILRDYLNFSWLIDFSKNNFKNDFSYFVLFSNKNNERFNKSFRWTHLSDTGFLEFYYWYKAILKESKI